MSWNEILIGIQVTIIGVLLAMITDGLFIKRARNGRPYLVKLGVVFFGQTNSRSEFITSKKAVIIKLIDIIVGLSLGIIFYKISLFVVEKTFVYYFPLPLSIHLIL